jgi:predicted nucleic acid-binding Zn ribbon protein
MKSADYKCETCGKIIEIQFHNGATFPADIQCPEFECQGTSRRVFSPLPSIVYKGRTGNAKNGYKSSPVALKKS